MTTPALPDDLIYRLLTEEDWQASKTSGALKYAPVDDEDGFFHLSAADQVWETAEKYYSHLSRMYLVGVKPAALGDLLKWEPSRGGALFPHVYGQVMTDQIAFRAVVTPSKAGGFLLHTEEE